jgi:predicted dehydrogenase
MKVGVIGLGSIGSRHAANLKGLGHEVVGYDPELWRMEALQGHAVAREEVFARKGIDAVVSASPTANHVDDLRDAVAYGVPILIEKPIATAITSELRDLLRDAEHDGQPVMVGYMLRFHGCVIKAKDWLGTGLIGQPLWASFTCAQLNDKYRHDGVILNWSHEIDLARYLLGPAKVICATARVTNGHDDIADLVLEHDGGARSTVHLDTVTRPEIRKASICGTKGVIHLRLAPSRIAGLVSYDNTVTVSPGDTWDDNYVTELKAFLRRAEGMPAFGATGADGLAVLDLCLQARKLAGLA